MKLQYVFHAANGWHGAHHINMAREQKDAINGSNSVTLGAPHNTAMIEFECFKVIQGDVHLVCGRCMELRNILRTRTSATPGPSNYQAFLVDLEDPGMYFKIFKYIWLVVVW